MRPMPQLEITTVPVDELVPYANNAKLHDANQVGQIAQSIREFGNNDPIAVWHNDKGEMEIVEGHGRLMALKKLGIETAEVITLDHLSDNQRRAYALIHNQLTMNSGFDFEILSSELAKIDEFDMGAYGFDTGEPISSEQWETEEEPEADVAWDDDEDLMDYDETFHCLFIYHNEEEARRLAGILGVEEPLKPAYRLSDIIGGVE